MSSQNFGDVSRKTGEDSHLIKKKFFEYSESEYYHFATLNEMMVFNITKTARNHMRPLKILSTIYEVFLSPQALQNKQNKRTP